LLKLTLGRYGLCCVAPALLAEASAATCYRNCGRAWCFLRAWVRGMTGFGTRMAAESLGLPAGLLTRLCSILALPGPVAVLLAEVRAAFERFATNLAASCI
jgi:hypothetical protein